MTANGTNGAPATAAPVVAAIAMGYGHLRPAAALATALGVPIHRVDSPPIAGADEVRQWERIRTVYEATSRWTGLPFVGRALHGFMTRATAIEPLHPHRDLSAPGFGSKRLDKLIRAGLARGITETVRGTGRPLLTTHFAPALAADAAGIENVWCVVTDSDIHRIWAPLQPARTRIQYLVPGTRALRRLRAYGVPEANVHVTGFPLPGELLGDDLAILKRNLAARLVRLDATRVLRDAHADELRHFLGPLPADQEGVPPRITFAVGGAGAQVEVAERFLPGLAPAILAGQWRLTLIAGVRREVADRLRAAAARHGLDGAPPDVFDVVYAEGHEDYFAAFNRVLADTDVLWTKPSETTFFGALGLAMVLARPLGVHESYNRRWARENGAGLKQRDPRFAHQWLREWLDDGLLAAAAWSGYTRLPKFGLQRILRLVTADGT